MPIPQNCPQEMYATYPQSNYIILSFPLHSYDVMLDCWREKPEDRPSFVKLRKRFDGLLAKQKNALYIDLIVSEDFTDNDLVKEEEQSDQNGELLQSGQKIKPSELMPEKMEHNNSSSSQKRNTNLYVENPLCGTPDSSARSLRSADTSPVSTSPMRDRVLSLPSSSHFESRSNVTSF